MTWQCMVGNYKKWKDEQVLELSLKRIMRIFHFSAHIHDRQQIAITFEWDNLSFSFAEIVELAGQIPLPPYLNRASEAKDKERYQTVYSQHKGAVPHPLLDYILPTASYHN